MGNVAVGPIVYYTQWNFVPERKSDYTYIHCSEFTATSVVSSNVN
jgi:hypothetical protein